MELITLTTKTRGRNSREVEYQGVGRVENPGTENEQVVTDGVLTSFEDALTLPGVEGNTQIALDLLARGYNQYRRDEALDVDEFAEFIDSSWDADKVSAFKRSVRALAKVAEIEISDAATLVKSKMAPRAA